MLPEKRQIEHFTQTDYRWVKDNNIPLENLIVGESGPWLDAEDTEYQIVESKLNKNGTDRFLETSI